jgi:HEAT repeat protein
MYPNGLLYSFDDKQPASTKLFLIESIRTLLADPVGTLALLTRATEDEDVEVRVSAYLALVHVCSLNERGLLVLISGLEDENAEVRAIVIRLLDAIPSNVYRFPAIAYRLVSCLHSIDSSVRCAVVRKLEHVGPSLSLVVRSLADVLSDVDVNVRLQAVSVLSNIGAVGQEILGPLLALLQDESPQIRMRTAIAIGSIGPDARPALEALKRALNDTDGEVAFFAASALTKIDPTERASIPVLLSHLRQYQKDRGRSAAEALQRLGAVAIDTVPTLIDALKAEEDKERRVALIRIIQSIVDDMIDS